MFPFSAHTGLLNATVTFIWTRGGKVLGQTGADDRRPRRRRPWQPAALQRGAVPDQVDPPPGDRSALAARAPERRAVVVALAARQDRGPAPRARPARHGETPAAHPPSARLRRLEHPRPDRLDDRQRLRRRSPPTPAATGRSPPPSSPRPSRCSRSRRRCADRAARRRSRGSGRRRAAAPGTGRSRTGSASTSGPSAASRWSKRARLSVISSSTGPSNWTTWWPPRSSTSHARRGERPHRRPGA